MKKTTLKKIIGAVRDLEVKKSRNDSQFEFYNKKKRRIERKERRMAKETNDNKEAIKYYKNNKETLDFCYGFMDKIENENKVINNQIEQYLTNYIVIVLVDKLNKLKTFNYKKLDKILNQIEEEANKIHKFNGSFCHLYIEGYYDILTVSFRGYSKTYGLMSKTKDYIESHLTKKTITKKFSIDDFSKKVINWNMKAPEEETQYNDQIENNLKSLKMQITKLVNEYNNEKNKLTINKENYQYMFIRWRIKQAMDKEIIISITKNGITSKLGMYESYYENMIIQLMNNDYCYLWQSETDTLLMLNRHTGDKIEFKIL